MGINKRVTIFILIFLSLNFVCKAQKESYPYSSSDRDPFVPLISKTGQILIAKLGSKTTNFVLQGIIFSSDTAKNLAVINGQILKEKEFIGDYQIISIEQKRVILKKDQEEIILELEEK